MLYLCHPRPQFYSPLDGSHPLSLGRSVLDQLPSYQPHSLAGQYKVPFVSLQIFAICQIWRILVDDHLKSPVVLVDGLSKLNLVSLADQGAQLGVVVHADVVAVEVSVDGVLPPLLLLVENVCRNSIIIFERMSKIFLKIYFKPAASSFCFISFCLEKYFLNAFWMILA